MTDIEKLNGLLRELGISKVKLAKYLGVSRQMIYNYLEMDNINKWPKDKKVLLLNLLGVKSAEELDNIKVDTDYILNVETRLNNMFEDTNNSMTSIPENNEELFGNLKKDAKELLSNILNIIKEDLEDEKDYEAYNAYRYLYYFLQAMSTSRELKFILGYVAKATGSIKPLEFVFDETEQFTFEGIMFSAMTLYNNGGSSQAKIAEAHRRFVNQIEHKIEEKMSRTMELNAIKVQALKELGFTEINESNASLIIEKMAEIESRRVSD